MYPHPAEIAAMHQQAQWRAAAEEAAHRRRVALLLLCDTVTSVVETDAGDSDD